NYQQDTWEFDGVQWHQRTPATVPVIMGDSMIYDLVRAQVLLLTHDANNTMSLWSWDGVDWTQRASPGPDQVGSAFVCDLGRHRAVLIGASAAATGSVMEWDGSTWRSIPAPGAAAIEPGAGWYDLGRLSVLVAGGQDVNAGTYVSDAWSWDGVA